MTAKPTKTAPKQIIASTREGHVASTRKGRRTAAKPVSTSKRRISSTREAVVRLPNRSWPPNRCRRWSKAKTTINSGRPSNGCRTEVGRRTDVDLEAKQSLASTREGRVASTLGGRVTSTQERRRTAAEPQSACSQQEVLVCYRQ